MNLIQDIIFTVIDSYGLCICQVKRRFRKDEVFFSLSY